MTVDKSENPFALRKATSPFVVTLEDGAQITGFDEGQGQTIFLISGLGGTASFWNPCVSVLAAHHRVLRLDQRGIAASTRGRATCSIEQLARDCLAVMDARDIDSAILIGHSTGGCIAQEMALLAPQRVQRLVLSGTWGQTNRYMQELFGLRRNMLASDPRAYASTAAFLTYEASWLNANWPVYEASLANAPLTSASQKIVQERIDALLSFDRSAALGDIRQPTLILGARDDVLVPAFLQESLANMLANAEIHIFSHGGHFFPITRTEAFFQTLINWLES